jgi:tetratricopeptide (TPR) repeat protein
MTEHVHDRGEPDVRYRTGLEHLRAGDNRAAAEGFRDVLRSDPRHPGARRNLIRALLAAGEHAAVLTESSAALCDAPESAELHYLRGTALNALRRSTEARDALRAAIDLNPNLAPAWLNLGNAHADLDDMEAAEAHCRHAIALDPQLIEARVSLGFILTARGEPEWAIGELVAAIRLSPKNVQAHWNLATAALLSGDLRRGFAEYEWRKRHDLFRHDFIDLPGPVWDGGEALGRTILVHAEQGLGDTIQFARYLPLIAARGGRPILAFEPSLIPLLRRIDGAQLASKFDPLPDYDAWIDQMSLPRVFATTLETIPLSAGYLSADPALVQAHRATLSEGRRIGLAWAGNPLHHNDRRRTPAEAVFERLTTLPGCRFVSLVPGRAIPGAPPPARPLIDYAETAALIASLDLVITVDTSVAHVAGALGRPAWVMLPHAPDWRWLLHRNDTPWYDSLRLFRQQSAGDWATVVAEIAAAVDAWRKAGRRGQ